MSDSDERHDSGARSSLNLRRVPESEIVKDQQLPDDLLEAGQRCWFEYHCYEGHDSSDAELWYRSHQQITILGVCPDADPPEKGTTFQERCEEATQGMYLVEFDDGHRASVFEDEVLDSPDGFCRPDPPEWPVKEKEHG